MVLYCLTMAIYSLTIRFMVCLFVLFQFGVLVAMISWFHFLYGSLISLKPFFVFFVWLML